MIHRKPAQDVPTLLTRYSGAGGWTKSPTSDKRFARHFPAFDVQSEKNTFFLAHGVAALAQQDVELAASALWIQSEAYPELLSEYRKTQRPR